MKSTVSEVLEALQARHDLSDAQCAWFLRALVSGQMDDANAEAFLLGLRVKGETAREIACAAQILRENMVRWDPGRDDVLDTCGTGGDGSGTFNISTATALVVAGAGVAVVKHGNRSVSSRSGSADVLTALGIRIDGDGDFARRCLREANFAFCFAPQFHPMLKNVAAVRRKLGVPTIFNCVGPLANPAGARRQLLGVGRFDLLDKIAAALAQIGTHYALVLWSQDGLDEVSLSASTLVREVKDGKVMSHTWSADDFGLATCALSELSAPHAEASANMIKEVLTGNDSAPQRVVLANAAAALLAAEQVRSLREGVERVRASIRSGAAGRVLETLQRLSVAEKG